VNRVSLHALMSPGLSGFREATRACPNRHNQRPIRLWIVVERIDQWDNTGIYQEIRDDDDGNDNDPFSEMKSITMERRVRSELRSCEYGVTQALSHVCLYVCMCVSMCMYMIHIHILCVSYVVLCTCMCIQFAGEQRVGMSEQTKTFIDEDSVHSELYAGILCVECACFILGYNCFGSPYTVTICTAQR